MPKERKKMLKGIISLMILKLLLYQSIHGYEINKILSNKLGEQLPPGYVYVLLKSMESKGLIYAKKDSNKRGQKLTEYIITEEGINFLKDHKNALEKGKAMIEELLEAIDKINKT
ncbi:MAG: PadR family transcriptional regulator [Caldisphaera sp.]|jgi:DNA-binding PadR family transcriptional regulator|nr:PadR family transcriptional regulator [Caldisphaera sp.]PMP91045.1 MAG: PadR family transcriptional regulator [Caldisphaera sp.]